MDFGTFLKNKDETQQWRDSGDAVDLGEGTSQQLQYYAQEDDLYSSANDSTSTMYNMQNDGDHYSDGNFPPEASYGQDYYGEHSQSCDDNYSSDYQYDRFGQDQRPPDPPNWGPPLHKPRGRGHTDSFRGFGGGHGSENGPGSRLDWLDAERGGNRGVRGNASYRGQETGRTRRPRGRQGGRGFERGRVSNRRFHGHSGNRGGHPHHQLYDEEFYNRGSAEVDQGYYAEDQHYGYEAPEMMGREKNYTNPMLDEDSGEVDAEKTPPEVAQMKETNEIKVESLEKPVEGSEMDTKGMEADMKGSEAPGAIKSQSDQDGEGLAKASDSQLTAGVSPSELQSVKGKADEENLVRKSVPAGPITMADYRAFDISESMVEEAEMEWPNPESGDIIEHRKKRSPLRCLLCQIETNSLTTFRAHLVGNRHRQKVEAARKKGILKSTKDKEGDNVETNLAELNTEMPVIGLSYITEYHSRKAKFMIWVCSLCSVKVRLTSVFIHVTGNKHRLLYLREHNYSAYAHVRDFQGKRCERSSLLDKYCTEAEKKDGRGDVKKMYEPAPEEEGDNEEKEKRQEDTGKDGNKEEKEKKPEDASEEPGSEKAEEKAANDASDAQELQQAKDQEAQRMLELAFEQWVDKDFERIKNTEKRRQPSPMPSEHDDEEEWPYPGRISGQEDFPGRHWRDDMPEFDPYYPYPRDPYLDMPPFPPFPPRPGGPYIRHPGLPGPYDMPPHHRPPFGERPPLPDPYDLYPPPLYPPYPRDPYLDHSKYLPPPLEPDPLRRYPHPLDRYPDPDPLRRLRADTYLDPDPLKRVLKTDRYLDPDPLKRALRTDSGTYLDPDPLKRVLKRDTTLDPDPLKRALRTDTYLDPDPLKRVLRTETYLDPDPTKRVLKRETNLDPDPLKRVLRTDRPLDPDPLKRKLPAVKPTVIDYGHGSSSGKSETGRSSRADGRSSKGKWEDDIQKILGPEKGKHAPDSLALLSSTYSSPERSPSPKRQRKDSRPLPFSKSYLEMPEALKKLKDKRERKDRPDSQDPGSRKNSESEGHSYSESRSRRRSRSPVTRSRGARNQGYSRFRKSRSPDSRRRRSQSPKFSRYDKSKREQPRSPDSARVPFSRRPRSPGRRGNPNPWNSRSPGSRDSSPDVVIIEENSPERARRSASQKQRSQSPARHGGGPNSQAGLRSKSPIPLPSTREVKSPVRTRGDRDMSGFPLRPGSGDRVAPSRPSTSPTPRRMASPPHAGRVSKHESRVQDILSETDEEAQAEKIADLLLQLSGSLTSKEDPNATLMALFSNSDLASALLALKSKNSGDKSGSVSTAIQGRSRNSGDGLDRQRPPSSGGRSSAEQYDRLSSAREGDRPYPRIRDSSGPSSSSRGLSPSSPIPSYSQIEREWRARSSGDHYDKRSAEQSSPSSRELPSRSSAAMSQSQRQWDRHGLLKDRQSSPRPPPANTPPPKPAPPPREKVTFSFSGFGRTVRTNLPSGFGEDEEDNK